MRSLVLILLAAACGSSDAGGMSKAWPDGCFIYRDANGKTHSTGDRCKEPRRPFSTFKIPNALIAVDAGVLDNADSSMTWDKARVPDEAKYLDVWRKPHTLRSGIAVSAVPYFRTLALDIGEERMRAGLAKLDYGNQDISGGLSEFWLSRGGMRISAEQQLAFVDALAQRKLALSKHAQDVVAEITILEKTGDDVLHGKTGSGPLEHGKGGWLVWQVGWIERAGAIIPYAAWMERADGTLDEAREARAKRLTAIFAKLDLWTK